MNLKLGISVYSIPKQDVNILLDFVVENGFEAIELWDSYPYSITQIHIKKMQSANLSISLHAPLLNLGNPSDFRTNVNHLEKTIKRAGTYGADIVVLHLGSVPSNCNPHHSLNTAHQIIKHVLGIVENEGLILCIENVGYLENDLLRDFYRIRDFIEPFPKTLVGVTFDVSHAKMTGDVHAGIDILRDRIRHFHLSDCDSNSQVHHLPIGSGGIDFSDLGNECFNYMGILEITPDNNWKRNLLNVREFLRGKNMSKKEENGYD